MRRPARMRRDHREVSTSSREKWRDLRAACATAPRRRGNPTVGASGNASALDEASAGWSGCCGSRGSTGDRASVVRPPRTRRWRPWCESLGEGSRPNRSAHLRFRAADFALRGCPVARRRVVPGFTFDARFRRGLSRRAFEALFRGALSRRGPRRSRLAGFGVFLFVAAEGLAGDLLVEQRAAAEQ